VKLNNYNSIRFQKVCELFEYLPVDLPTLLKTVIIIFLFTTGKYKPQDSRGKE